MDRRTLLDALEREAEAFTAVLRTADLGLPVPSCPGWDLVELAAHLAGVHRWATGALVEGTLVRRPTPALDSRQDVVDEYSSAAGALLEALRSRTDDAPCPTFQTPDGTAAFWLRRQVHELTVHRWDAEHAAGLDPHVDGELAADGVSEVLEVFLPRMRARGLLGDLPATVELRRTDGGQSWLLGEGTPSAVVAAPAGELLLLLWQRVVVDETRVDGDVDAARAVLASPLTP